jgi:chromosome segregation ATPase
MRRRDFDAGMALVRRDIAQVQAAVEDRSRADEALVANVARVDDRVVAATEEAADKVRHADAQAADTVAAVRAEAAGEAGHWRSQVQAATVERDQLRTELERMTAAWRARTEQLGVAEAEASRWEQRASELEVTVDALTDALVRAVDLLERAIDKVPARTTRRRYLAELAALTAPPVGAGTEGSTSPVEVSPTGTPVPAPATAA